MPLIHITLKPGYTLRFTDDRAATETEEATCQMIKRDFSRVLPTLLIRNEAELGLDPGTPTDGVQVTNGDFGEYDVNVPGFWIKIQLSEPLPGATDRERIRDRFYEVIIDWFYEQGYVASLSLVIDLLWGPTHGRGTVNGTKIKW